jgi:nicotinamidase-related amidase
VSAQQAVSLGAEFEIVPSKTALIVIDMNYVDSHRDYGVAPVIKALGLPADAFFDEIDNKVIPNIQKLLAAFRKNGMKVVYTVIGAELPDLSDLTPIHQALFRSTGLDRSIPGNKEFEIREEVKPIPGELVLVKKSFGAFNSTNIDQMLRNMGVDTIVVVGVLTNQCVFLSAVDAGDRGYLTVVVSDATAALPPELQDIFLMVGSLAYFKVQTTDEVISRIEKALKRG